MKKIFLKAFILILISTIVLSCTEPYALQTNSFEDAVVIEATVTNELKKQEIKLTRTYRLEEHGPQFEEGAVVYLTDNLGNQYDFEEMDEKYVSTNEFQAVPNRNYTLHITTSNGKSYISSNEQLTTVNPIESVTATVGIQDGIRGVQIKVNSFDPTNTSKYYRYEYDETYKIVAPQWINQEAIATYFPHGSNPPGEITYQTRTVEAKTCYSSKKSNKLMLVSTGNLSEDRVSSTLRFIGQENFIIMHRYSILVKQYIQNLQSYTFYETLKKLSGSESILSQNQPGFFSGNIKCVDNPSEKVIGFFDVSSYSEKRIFFNYGDLFPGEPLPFYPWNCPDVDESNKLDFTYSFCFNYQNPRCYGNEILSWISGRTQVFGGNYEEDLILYPIQCGDCTSFSSNIKPSFWID